MVPSVVSAVKSGASEFIRKDMIYALLSGLSGTADSIIFEDWDYELRSEGQMTNARLSVCCRPKDYAARFRGNSSRNYLK